MVVQPDMTPQEYLRDHYEHTMYWFIAGYAVASDGTVSRKRMVEQARAYAGDYMAWLADPAGEEPRRSTYACAACEPQETSS